MNSVTYNLCDLDKLPILFKFCFSLQENKNNGLLVSQYVIRIIRHNFWKRDIESYKLLFLKK